MHLCDVGHVNHGTQLENTEGNVYEHPWIGGSWGPGTNSLPVPREG